MEEAVNLRPKSSRRNMIIGLAVVLVLLALYIFFVVQDWHQLWKIVSAPDNIPTVAMLFLVPFFTWRRVKHASAGEDLAATFEADPKRAKRHHRNPRPWRPAWAIELDVWPD